jgi:hypothetical protein
VETGRFGEFGPATSLRCVMSRLRIVAAEWFAAVERLRARALSEMQRALTNGKSIPLHESQFN